MDNERKYLHIESYGGDLYVYSDNRTHEGFQILSFTDLDYNCVMQSGFDSDAYKISIILESEKPKKSTVVPKKVTKTTKATKPKLKAKQKLTQKEKK